MSGISLHAGVSRGAAGWLRSPAVDACDLAAAAAARGFGVQRVLIDPARDEFTRELSVAITHTRRGDTLLITFSGHAHEEAWCFTDGDLPLRDLCDALDALPRRTFVYVVADACHPEVWRELPKRSEVMVIAPPDGYVRDGLGKNTRSPFTAALIRAMHESPSLLRVVRAFPAPRRGRPCCDTGARRTR